MRIEFGMEPTEGKKKKQSLLRSAICFPLFFLLAQETLSGRKEFVLEKNVYT